MVPWLASLLLFADVALMCRIFLHRPPVLSTEGTES